MASATRLINACADARIRGLVDQQLRPVQEDPGEIDPTIISLDISMSGQDGIELIGNTSASVKVSRTAG
jgi:hypothetical protein